MATYEVTVDRVAGTVITSWSPSPTGAGAQSNRYEFEDGDVIKFKKLSSSTGTVSVVPTNDFFTTNGSVSVGLSFVSRVVNNATGNYQLDYSIFYTDGPGGL